ncbi:helix-turn-helix domain-containing protein [Streptomyces sp. NPDC051658]|uniref:helix-turn-helix domain-containing protein n=1 Tax=Streptomyces sp. NPDC051658 TaxID=3365667 RepID=UPI0037AFF4FA
MSRLCRVAARTASDGTAPLQPAPLLLSEQDRLTLRSWSRSRSIRAGYVERARIVLECAQPGAGTSSVAAAVGSTRPTVIKWRELFRAHGLAGAGRTGTCRPVGA